jgi:DNA invertase Pin-like site-specific DNA recombinase
MTCMRPSVERRTPHRPLKSMPATSRRLMLTVLGALAEFERELIRVRTHDGRERAKAKGVRLGRKPKLTEHQRKEAIRRRNKGEESHAEIGRSYNVSGWTIGRLGP